MTTLPPTLQLPLGHLDIRGGSRDGQNIPLQGTPRVLTLGRDPRCVISFHPTLDPTVSRQHARLRLTSAGATLEDLGSSQGTYLWGARVTRTTALHSGDEIQLGRGGPTLTFHWGEQEVTYLLEEEHEADTTTPPTFIVLPPAKVQEPPTLKLAPQAQEQPTLKLAPQAQEQPTLQLASQAQEQPTLQLASQAQEPPTLKLSPEPSQGTALLHPLPHFNTSPKAGPLPSADTLPIPHHPPAPKSPSPRSPLSQRLLTSVPLQALLLTLLFTMSCCLGIALGRLFS